MSFQPASSGKIAVGSSVVAMIMGANWLSLFPLHPYVGTSDASHWSGAILLVIAGVQLQRGLALMRAKSRIEETA